MSRGRTTPGCGRPFLCYRQMMLRCRGAFADAFLDAIQQDRLGRIIRGPASVMACLAAVALLT